MKLAFYYLQSGKEPWAESAVQLYVKKISPMISFELKPLKSKSEKRDNAEKKKQAEAKTILDQIQPTDHLILFDEKGKEFRSSVCFSEFMTKRFELGKQRVVFVIGGPYGFSEDVKQRANDKISLSKLTLNHHVAIVTALEQIYRGFTIWKGTPYHNV